ncbi:MAG: rhodanese-like domain-containing protein [Chloroflexota bacterium]
MFSSLRKLFAGPPSITIEELDQLLSQNAVRVLDVREPSEFRQGHVPGAVNVPKGKLGGQIDKLKRDKPYAVICASGSRSMGATATLLNAGFEGAVSVRGGTSAWARSGRMIKR